tara:strand:+ start:238 stop:633 length:396 start_codon:yes stop_codon:yes gene_type:complete
MDDSIFILECLNAGILPPAFKDTKILSESPVEYLAQLSPEESRRVRRKFRKLHRKIKRQQVRKVKQKLTRKGIKNTGYRVVPWRQRSDLVNDNLKRLDLEFGPAGEPPDTSQKRHRRFLVMQEIWRKIPKK